MFGKGEMQKEFEEVAFALEPGQVSGVVDTASGVHLIQRWVTMIMEDICLRCSISKSREESTDVPPRLE